MIPCELLVSGCDVSPILPRTQVRGALLQACERSQTIDYALSSSILVASGRKSLPKQQVQVVNMVLGGYRLCTLPIDVDEVEGHAFPEPL